MIVNARLQVSGTDGAEQIALRLRATDPTVLEVDAGNDGTADFLFPRAAFTSINVDLAGGADVGRIDQSGGVFTYTQPTTFNGGDGNDTLFGGNGPETFNGGAGRDFVDGRQGSDVISLGAGNDLFEWDPGDGSDVVNGNAGVDRMLFNGANVTENIDLSANGSRLRFTRDIASITMDIGTVEQIDLPIRGGSDKVAVHDLSGTTVQSVNVDLANVDPTVGDGQPDQVVAEGTEAADTVSVTGANGVGTVTGLAATVNVAHAELANDIFSVNTLGGDDRVTADPATGSAVRAQIDTGTGNDSVVTNGTSGPDTFNAVPDGSVRRRRQRQQPVLRRGRRITHDQRLRRRRLDQRQQRDRKPHRAGRRRGRRQRHPPRRRRRGRDQRWDRQRLRRRQPGPRPGVDGRRRRCLQLGPG